MVRIRPHWCLRLIVLAVGLALMLYTSVRVMRWITRTGWVLPERP